MRYSAKGEITNNPTNQLFGVDFHDFMQQETGSSNMELAQEFGVTLRAVKDMKKRIGRN
ncbi:RNA polymerase subunit sigma-70 [Bacillus sp. Marseille-P3661]|uniref:RNA polymerase subunit sigma-70 n=1 Tax=Bacillus sp. Marseille-P3661 TaxID=1936234 RepID=UPI000C837C23|nr:RNA polymerase subunit sigma-70 [Bacillus sp. Marseille-P3661]